MRATMLSWPHRAAVGSLTAFALIASWPQRRKSPRLHADRGPCSGSNRVVAELVKLDQAEAMAEWVGKHGDPAPGPRIGGRFEDRSRLCGAGDCGVQVGDHHVQVDRGPVAGGGGARPPPAPP